MSDKKPAHEVILEMIEEGIKEIGNKGGSEYERIRVHGKLAAEVEILKRMIIPQKHIEEVLLSLTRIKEGTSPPKIGQLLLPDSVFLAISPPAEKV
jgi:hypothetical protein